MAAATGLPYAPEDPGRETWDLIVVGTGMGGSTFGWAMARRGQRVLFLEKGLLQKSADLSGAGLEADTDGGEDFRLRHGLWPRPLEGTTSFGDIRFFAPWGCGAGGSTAIYASALERFEPMDFRPRELFPEAPDATLPEAWPVSYAEMAPHYREAEALFRVRGTADPLSVGGPTRLLEPPPLGARDQHLHGSWTAGGLHPYRLHVGCEYLPGCGECGGSICARECKSDAKRICLLPALEQHGAHILAECEVLALEASRERVERVHARWRGRRLALRARRVALAAGAWMTPVILLRSRSAAWPDGIANRSGQVGRNLMLHASDYYAVQPIGKHGSGGPSKSLALNDFYVCSGKKLGTFQSAGGGSVSAEAVSWFLGRRLDRDPRRWHPLVRPLLPTVARIAARAFRDAAVFTTIVEDLPYAENRVVADDSGVNGMRFQYRYPDELRERCRLFGQALRRALAPHRVMRLTGANNLNFGHVCGTCRFGDDPRTSVLDRDNRAHDLENLYVVDASFFPSSGGTNPSLTIAANALRVAAALAGRIDAPEAVRARYDGGPPALGGEDPRGSVGSAAAAPAGSPGPLVMSARGRGSDTLRIGVLGTGRVAPMAVLGPAQATPGVEVVAVASRSAERAGAFAREHGISQAFGSYEELLAHDGVDAVYVALPTALHHVWASRALDAGKHVLCEKPLALTGDLAEALTAQARERGRVLQEAMQIRFQPRLHRLREIVTEGRLGPLLRVDACFRLPRVPMIEGDFRLSRELGGGAILDLGCYAAACLRHVAGEEPEVRKARWRRAASGVERWARATCVFPSGLEGSIECGFRGFYRPRLGTFVRGERGWARWEGTRLTWRADGVEVEEAVEDAAPYALQLAAFARSCRGEASEAPAPEDVVARLRILDAIRARAGGEAS